jgi:hypothetical protein
MDPFQDPTVAELQRRQRTPHVTASRTSCRSEWEHEMAHLRRTSAPWQVDDAIGTREIAIGIFPDMPPHL